MGYSRRKQLGRQGGGARQTHRDTWKRLVSRWVRAEACCLCLSVLFLFHFRSFTSQNRNQISSAVAEFGLPTVSACKGEV